MRSNRDPYKLEVGERLRVTAAELGFPSALPLSQFLGEKRATVDAWFNGKSLPPVPPMLQLRKQFYVTLDWIFCGDASGLQMSCGTRLLAAMEESDVPAAVRSPVLADEPAAGAARTRAAAEPVRKPVRRRSKASGMHI